jgi:Glycosyl transferase family 2
MTSAKSIVGALLPVALKSKLREQHIDRNIVHLFGPRSVSLSGDEAAVTCVVKNGAYYIESFIEHYMEMGFSHIFFLDNGSTDDTLSIARRYSNVSASRCTLPINSHQRLFKKHLAKRSVNNAWCLDADIDEFFDYPRSEVVSLHELLKYLNRNHFTAMLTQLLDMFSDMPLSYLTDEKSENVSEVYRYYDLGDVTKTSYRGSELAVKYASANRLTKNEPLLCWGGVRKALYGNDCLLTKHSLFFVDKKIDLFTHVHFANRASVADVSGVMLHYKLTSNALAMALQNRDNFTQNSKTYGAFVSLLESGSDQTLKRGTTREFVNASELVESEFLSISPAYEEYATTK